MTWRIQSAYAISTWMDSDEKIPSDCHLKNLDSVVKVGMRSTANISYENHKGTLFTECNKVVFYGVMFKNMCSASKVLREIKLNDNLQPFFYKKYRGFIVDGAETVVDTEEGKRALWFADHEYACLYLKNRRPYRV